MSLLADYLKEHGHKSIIEDEKSFATYMFIKDQCYIEDVYVAPEARNQDICKNLVNEISKIAKLKGFNKLMITCIPSANGSTVSLKAALGCGFNLQSAHENVIVCVKDI